MHLWDVPSSPLVPSLLYLCTSWALISLLWIISAIKTFLSTFAKPASNRCNLMNRNLKSVDMRYSVGPFHNRLATKCSAFRLDSNEKRAACFQFRNCVWRRKHHTRPMHTATAVSSSKTRFNTHTTLCVMRLASTQCTLKSKGQSKSSVVMLQKSFDCSLVQGISPSGTGGQKKEGWNTW